MHSLVCVPQTGELQPRATRLGFCLTFTFLRATVWGDSLEPRIFDLVTNHARVWGKSEGTDLESCHAFTYLGDTGACKKNARRPSNTLEAS